MKSRRAKGSPQLVRGLALTLVLALLAAGIWAWQFREEPLYVVGRCASCEAIVKVEWSATQWPAKCPRCGQSAVHYALMCPNGHVFTRAFPYTSEGCPECGADRGRPLTEEEYIRLGHLR